MLHSNDLVTHNFRGESKILRGKIPPNSPRINTWAGYRLEQCEYSFLLKEINSNNIKVVTLGIKPTTFRLAG